jgi:hypothetical protein
MLTRCRLVLPACRSYPGWFMAAPIVGIAPLTLVAQDTGVVVFVLLIGGGVVSLVPVIYIPK